MILEFSDYQIQIQDISKSQKVYVSRGNVKTKIQRLRFFQAYQKFGQGIREVSNELKEMKRTGIYPAATPPRDAPSPTANDDIYATGVEAALNCKDFYAHISSRFFYFLSFPEKRKVCLLAHKNSSGSSSECRTHNKTLDF